VLVVNGYQYYQTSAELTQTLEQLKSAPDKAATTQPSGPAKAPAGDRLRDPGDEFGGLVVE